MKRTTLGFAVLVALVCMHSARGAPVQWSGNMHWYEPVLADPGGITAIAANDAATSAGGYMVTIGSAAENTFVYGLVSGNDDFWFIDTAGNGQGPWLGGYQLAGSPEPDGGWRWVTTEPWSYTNWSAPTEPNDCCSPTIDNEENFLQFFGHQTLKSPVWNDMNNTPHETGYIIEYDPATIGLSNPVGDTIITGGSGTLGATVTNTAGDTAVDLHYTLSADVVFGAGNLGTVSPGSGTLAPGFQHSNTVGASSTHVGDNTIRFTATDDDAGNSPQTIDTTLAVLDHSHASLDSHSQQTYRMIDFGRLLRNARVGDRQFSVANRAIGYDADDTADLDLDSFTPNDSGPLATTLSTFGGLPAGSSNGYLASLSTDTSGSFVKVVGLGLSDEDLPGAGEPNSQSLTLDLRAVVGHAIADSSNENDQFGPPLTAQVPGQLFPSSYAGLESTVVATTGVGGIGSDDNPMTGTTATILAGNNVGGVDTGVSMAWRTATTEEPALRSDVVNLSRMVNDGQEHGQTDKFVLQMDYDEALFGEDEQSLAENGRIFLVWLDPADETWKNAIRGNYGENVGAENVQGAWKQTMDFDLGAWGVDVEHNVVWAVLDHNSQFGIVPEPSTLALTALALLSLLMQARRRRP